MMRRPVAVAGGEPLIASVWSAIGASAAILAAAAFAVLVAFLAAMLAHINGILDSTKRTIDDAREEAVPILTEVRKTVEGVNKQLDHVDGMATSVQHIVRSAERLSSVVEQTVSSPLIKVAAAGAGLSRVLRRSRKER